VPEAAHHKDRDLSSGEGDVGATRDGLWVESIAAMPHLPECFSQEKFGRGVLGAVGAHYTRDGLALGRGGSFVADVHFTNVKCTVQIAKLQFDKILIADLGQRRVEFWQ
jgi:hypothetical protein